MIWEGGHIGQGEDNTTVLAVKAVNMTLNLGHISGIQFAVDNRYFDLIEM